MKIVTDKINMGKTMSFDDFANKVLGKNETKTASAEPVIKTAAAKEEGVEKKKFQVVENKPEFDGEQKESDKEAKSAPVTKVAKEEKENPFAKKDKEEDEKEVKESCGETVAEASANKTNIKSAGKAPVSNEKSSKITKKYVKIANLDPKNKAFVHEFFSKIYGKDYADALVADR